MKRLLIGAVLVSVLGVPAGAAFAHGPGAGGGGGWGHMGPGMAQMGQGHMGQGHMGQWTGQGDCPGRTARGAPEAQITREKAGEVAQQYADQYLEGFAVDKVLPFTGMHGTMYSVELKGPQDEVRIFHVNPWGHVMPFGGPGRRAG